MSIKSASLKRYGGVCRKRVKRHLRWRSGIGINMKKLALAIGGGGSCALYNGRMRRPAEKSRRERENIVLQPENEAEENGWRHLKAYQMSRNDESSRR